MTNALRNLAQWEAVKSRIKLGLISISAAGQPRVAVVREEGSNGDREMSASLYMAGFEVGIRGRYIAKLCCWCSLLNLTFL